MNAGSPRRRPDRLWGIYAAEGSLWGELRYFAGKLAGTRHCALCDITHGTLRMKPTYRHVASRATWSLELVHEDERSPALAEATLDATPCVVAQWDEATGPVFLRLFDGAALDAMGGDPERFAAELERVLAEFAASMR